MHYTQRNHWLNDLVIIKIIIIIMEANSSEIIKVKYDPKTKNSGVNGVANSEYLLRMNFLQQAT